MLDAEQREAFAKGKEQFNEAWVVAPEPGGVWGLGPTFNEDRCAHCHANNGSAAAPANGQPAVEGVLVRLSIPGRTKEGGPLPHPVYGDQLQNRGIPGRVPAEGQAVFTYTTRDVSFADGEKVVLRVPHIEFTDLQFGELGADIQVSAAHRPRDGGDGSARSGARGSHPAHRRTSRRSSAWRASPTTSGMWRTSRRCSGRFGWKANQPNLRQQTAAAFLGDIGATTYMFPEENCPPAQLACLDVPSASKCGGQGGCTGNQYRPEVVPSRLTNITLYLQGLAVPARRNVTDPVFARGEALFSPGPVQRLSRAGARRPDRSRR